MENILVTGGAGFIGSHLVGRLLKENNKVVAVDNFTLGKKENVASHANDSNFELVEMDAQNIDAIEAVMKQYNIDRVYHLAANSDIQQSARDPMIDYRNTFNTTYSVLEAMRRTGCKKLFFASTSAVYGEKTDVNITENIGGLAPISY